MGNRGYLISFGGCTTTTSCQFRFSSPFYKYFWFYKARPTASPDSFFLFVLHDRFITLTILLHFIVFISYLLFGIGFLFCVFLIYFQAEWRKHGAFLHFFNFFTGALYLFCHFHRHIAGGVSILYPLLLNYYYYSTISSGATFFFSFFGFGSGAW